MSDKNKPKSDGNQPWKRRLVAAALEFQSEVKRDKRVSTSGMSFEFLSLQSLINASLDILPRHGLYLDQWTEERDLGDGKAQLVIKTSLHEIDKEGKPLKSSAARIPIAPAGETRHTKEWKDRQGYINKKETITRTFDYQGLGKTLTGVRRYEIFVTLGIFPEDEKNDGPAEGGAAARSRERSAPPNYSQEEIDSLGRASAPPRGKK